MSLITIDGAAGEGGGQVLRTALGLSLVTGRGFRIERIRAARQRPGLQAQHLAAVRAAAEVGGARVNGAATGSAALTFEPRAVRPGAHRFAIGTAGSTTLVLQTVLPALMTAAAPSTLTIEGGTHNIWAPPFDFIERAFLPLLARMGPRCTVTLDRYGFYPAGGGRFSAAIEPAPLRPLELMTRGAIRRRAIRAVVSRLPLSIAEREIETARNILDWPADCGRVESVASVGPGNAVSIEIASDEVTEVFVGFGAKGVPAETVARGAAEAANEYLAADVPVGEHLADQLLIPLALTGRGSFLTTQPSSHTTTNIAVIHQFLDVAITREQVGPTTWRIAVG